MVNAKPIEEIIREVLAENLGSGTSDHEKRMIALMNGDKPKNESEQRLKEQIDQMQKDGKVIEIPSM